LAIGAATQVNLGSLSTLCQHHKIGLFDWFRQDASEQNAPADMSAIGRKFATRRPELRRFGS